MTSSRALLLAVALLLLACPAVQAYEPKELGPSWRDLGQTAYGEKDWADAIFYYRKWLEADPQDENTWYNLACCYALVDQADKALEALETAVDAGWQDTIWPLEDPDLEAVREHERFTAAIARAKAQGDKDAPKGYQRHRIAIPAIGTYIAMLPPDHDEEKELPLVVILHGNGSTETQHGRLADACGREGVLYIAPRAPYPNSGVFTGMRRPGWTWAPDDAAEGSLEALEPSVRYVDSILAAVEDARKRYRVKGNRFYVIGHSMGGFFANVTAVLHPDKVVSCFAYAGGLPTEYHDAKWLTPLKEHGVKVFMAHGRADPVVPVARTEKAHALMHAAGVDVTSYVVDDQDHGISDHIRMTMHMWIDEQVRGKP